MLASIRAFLWRLINLTCRHKSDGSLDRELEFHLDMEITENLRQGMSPEEARRRALIALGGIDQTKEVYRETGAIRWLEALARDVRYGGRMFRRNPGFTAVAVITLALGIGGNTAIFSLIDGILFRPFPVSEPNQLVAIDGPVSYPDYLDLRKAGIFTDVLVFRGSEQGYSLSSEERSEWLWGECVSANYFRLLGVHLALGRGFIEADETPGASPKVVISYGFWVRAFGSDASVAGKILKINGEPLTVVGVAPKGFRGMTVNRGAPEIWFLPTTFVEVYHLSRYPLWHDVIHSRDLRWLDLIARLAPGATLQQARAQMRVLSQRFQKEYPQSTRDWNPTVIPLAETRRYGRSVSLSLGLLANAAGFVLLISCTNVAGLLLARTVARRREIATRIALGASRLRVMRQTLTESMLLWLFGLAAGLLVAFWTMRLIPYFQRSFGLGDLQLEIDSRILFFALALSLVTSLVFGLFPALVASRSEPYEELRAQGNLGGPRKSGLRHFLVVVQIAISLILLVGAGLFLRTLRNMGAVDPGFKVDNLLLLSVEPLFSVSDKLQHDDVLEMEFDRRALSFVREIPGVESAGWSSWATPQQMSRPEASIVLEEKAVSDKLDWSAIEGNVISSGYLKVMRIPLLAGRDFSNQDDEKSPRVVIINQTMARRYWPNTDPIGKRILVTPEPYPDPPGSGKKPEFFEVIGIAKDAKYGTLWEDAKPYAYFLFYQRFRPGGMILYVHALADPAPLLPPIKAEMRALDPGILMYDGMSASEKLAAGLSQQRAAASLLGLSGLLAVALASIGLYGVMSYSVTQRTREFGIRIAIGANRIDIMGLVFREGMMLVLLGMVIGLPCALGLTKLIASSLHGVKPTDPATYISISLLSLVIASVSVYLPARRAIRNPMASLRCE